MSTKFILQKLLKSIPRSNDRDVPLPSPFPLPQNYRAEVAAALEVGQMTADTEKAFFSSIASAICKYKKTPTTILDGKLSGDDTTINVMVS